MNTTGKLEARKHHTNNEQESDKTSRVGQQRQRQQETEGRKDPETKTDRTRELGMKKGKTMGKMKEMTRNRKKQKKFRC